MQELVADFDGTVLVVSHDRDFLDRVATTTIAMEGDGRAVIYAGGWSDYRAQRGEVAARPEAKKIARKPEPKRAERISARLSPTRLSYTQQKRRDDLPAEIDRLGAEIAKLERFLTSPATFTREPGKLRKGSAGLAERQQRLAAAEEEWLELEGLREALGGVR